MPTPSTAPLRRLLLPLLLLAAGPALAQSGTLTARVVDAESSLPLPTATVALYPAGGADSTFAGGAAADLDGDVRVTGVEAGTYDVVVSFVGYDDARRAGVEVGPGGADLGTVGLEPSAEALAEVRVTGERPQVQTRIDRTVYDTADDPVAEGGTATDVLATLPSVDVDIDGNVSLRGAGSVAVFINGRPAPVSGDFVASYLASLPAGSIERVEVIPNPSAAFEPDGVGGIINIVLKDDADLGLGGTVTAGTDTQGGYDGTVALTYGSGPWSLAATYGYRNDARAGSGLSYRINRYEAADPEGVGPTTLDQNEVEDRTRTSHLANLSADYSFSRNTTLTSQLQVGTRGGDEVETNTTLRSSAAGDPLLEYERISEELDDGLSFDARLGLRQTFGEGHRLVVEARGEASDEGELQTYNETLLGGAGTLDTPQRVDEDETERELSLQLDYTRPVGAFRLDAGYKGDYESESSALRSESLGADGAYVPDADVNNRFDYDQTVHALYAQVAAERGPWGAQAGLRFEQAQTTFSLLTTGEAFDNDYASLFPSAFLSFAPSEATTFKASYSRRINRPRTYALNPFPSFDDPLNIRQGNPSLSPEYVDAFEVGVTHDDRVGLALAHAVRPAHDRHHPPALDRPRRRRDGADVRQPRHVGLVRGRVRDVVRGPRRAGRLPLPGGVPAPDGGDDGRRRPLERRLRLGRPRQRELRARRPDRPGRPRPPGDRPLLRPARHGARPRRRPDVHRPRAPPEAPRRPGQPDAPAPRPARARRVLVHARPGRPFPAVRARLGRPTGRPHVLVPVRPAGAPPRAGRRPRRRRRLRRRGVLAAPPAHRGGVVSDRPPPELPPGGAVHAPPGPPCLTPPVALSRPQKISLWVGVVVVAAALLVLPQFLGGEAEAEAPLEGGRGGGDTLAVTVAPVSQELLEDRVTTTGTLLPWEAVDLRAEVAGRVTGLNFSEGSFVREGQTLVSLDTQVLQAQIEGARTRRDLASVQAQRRRELFEIGGLSRQALDEAESAARVLDAELAQLSAEVRRRRIVAPFSGQIGLREVSPGAYLSPGDRVATLRITGQLRLEFTVPERYLGAGSATGEPVRFTVPGQPDPFVATVYAIEPNVDPATRAFTVRARVRNPGNVLQPGAFAEVELVLDEVPDALLIPTAAVTTGADSTTVWVLQGGAAVPRSVTTGVRTVDRVQVTSGLSASDVVLTSGLNQVRPGQAVRPGGAFDPTRVRPEGTPERTREYQAVQ